MSFRAHSILLADDEPVTRFAIQAVLVDRGYEVQPARDGEEGCSLLASMQDDFPELLITDVDMPKLCGEELAQFARQRCDGIKLLFTSGTPQPALQKSIATDANARFLEKPFLAKQLLAKMHELGVS